jgi:hypothetical protein
MSFCHAVEQEFGGSEARTVMSGEVKRKEIEQEREPLAT